jgi:hypothetical protein
MIIYDSTGKNKTGALSSIFVDAIKVCKKLVAGCIGETQSFENLKYNPIGYVLSADKEYEDNKLLKRENMLKARNKKLKTDFKKRIMQNSKPAIPACSPKDDHHRVQKVNRDMKNAR